MVALPGGNLSHFHEPIRSYLEGSEDIELVSARSTVTRICVSTRDLVPPSGMLGTIIRMLRDVYHVFVCAKDEMWGHTKSKIPLVGAPPFG